MHLWVEFTDYYFAEYEIYKMNKNTFNFFLLFPLFILISCQNFQIEKQDTNPISHELYDNLLKKHVSSEGKVNYKGFFKDSTVLTKYLEILQDNLPNSKSWSKNQQLAYWLNAYNAFTIQLILNNYPLGSIKDIGSKIQIPFVNTPWDIKFIKINGKKYNLNNIEHNILRKNFNEPRIHFAIVCASFSCPNLRSESYSANKIEVQLTEQAKAFINDASKNKITKEKIIISKIFSWFKKDFTKDKSLIDFLNKYSKNRINADAKVLYKDYDWALNEL